MNDTEVGKRVGYKRRGAGPSGGTDPLELAYRKRRRRRKKRSVVDDFRRRTGRVEDDFPEAFTPLDGGRAFS